jgi:hypothetical protein
MSSGGVLLTFVCILVSASVLMAIIFRFWPKYGSVTAAVEQSDRFLEDLNTPH